MRRYNIIISKKHSAFPEMLGYVHTQYNIHLQY